MHLTKHIRSHTGEKAYKCHQCGKSYSRKNELNRHFKVHTREEVYKCLLCNKVFTRDTHLGSHLRTHTIEKLHQCNMCDKAFSEKYNLDQHKRTHIQEKPYKCSMCDKAFRRKLHLQNHIKTHNEAYGETGNSCSLNSTSCNYPNCTKSFYHHTKLINHVKENHDLDIKSTEHFFPSMKEFLTWKETQEAETFTYYSKQSSVKESKSDSFYIYYYCQKSGNSIPHRTKGNRSRKTTRRNKKGVIKTDTFCPSRLLCKIDQAGAITVTYIHTHYHKPLFQDTEHHPIPASVLELIKQKLSLGIPVDDVYKSLREGKAARENRDDSNNILQRKHLITKRQIKEIARKMKVNRRFHENDAMSVELIINNLQREALNPKILFNPVLLYKPQNQNDFEIGPCSQNSKYKLDKEDFLLAIMTKQQLHMILDSPEILCVDSTHCTNHYDFKLTTIVVPDEFGKGYPVGFFISNKEDTKSLYYFFEAIKEAGEKHFGRTLSVNALMTDDDNTGWAAFKEVFGEDVPHFLCKWHLYRTWLRKLRELYPQDQQLQTELYTNLVVLTEEKSLESFTSMKERFKELYKNKCKDFVDYMDKNYFNRSENWAMCYRQFSHADTDTNMYVESFHNRLKTFYMNRRLNKRVDDLLNILLDIEEEDYWRHLGDMKYKSGRSMQKETSRHTRGIKIQDTDVVKINDCKWTVKSQTSSEDNDDDIENYEVELKHTDCFDDYCFTKCFEISCIGLCSHMYQCSCSDTNNLCKHIHKTHSLRVKSFQVSRSIISNIIESHDNDYTDIDPLTIYNTETIELDNRPKESKLKLKRTLNAYENLNNYLNDETIKALALDHILPTLEQLILYCEAIKNNANKDLTAFKDSLKFAPNSKHKHKRVKGRYSEPKEDDSSLIQTPKVSFIQTSKKKKKVNKVVKRPTAQERKDKRELLLRREEVTLNDQNLRENASPNRNPNIDTNDHTKDISSKNTRAMSLTTENSSTKKKQ